MPDIPLVVGQNTFNKPIKYTDTVFELRGTSAKGTYEDSMVGLRGIAMQVMDTNKSGKTQFLKNKSSFVRFVNQEKGRMFLIL